MKGEVGVYDHTHRPEVYADTPGLLEQLAEVDRLARRYALISSWLIGNNEDFLMSSTYGTPPPCIVVHTTWGDLRKSLLGGIPIYGGLVRYTDVHNTWIGEDTLFRWHMQKRTRFEGEKELRLIIASPGHSLANSDRQPVGHKIEVDLDPLLRSVSLVGMFLRSSTSEAIKAYLLSIGIEVPVREIH